MKRNWLTIGVVAAWSLVDVPGVRAACDVEPRWRPVVVNGAVCGTAMSVSRLRFDDADLDLRDARGAVVATAHTDAKGNFRFPVVPEGTYSFSVQGLLTANGGVRVTGRQQQCGRPVTVTFKIGDHGCLSHVQFEGTLQVASNIDDISITIDDDPGLDLDEDDTQIWLDEGIHHIVIEGPPGYRPLTARVRIRAGRTTTYRAELRREHR